MQALCPTAPSLSCLLDAVAAMHKNKIPPCPCCYCYHFEYSQEQLRELFTDQQFIVCYASLKYSPTNFQILGIHFVPKPQEK